MSITSKIILDQRRPKADKTCPVRLRVYNKTEYKELSIGISVKPEDWNEAIQMVICTAPHHELHNMKILSYKLKLQKLILLAELNENEVISLPDIISKLSNEKPAAEKPKKEIVSIIKYGQDIITQLTNSGKVGNAFAYGCAVNKLKSFAGSNIAFEDLTYKKLVEFQDSMLAEGIKVNSISVYKRTIRAIYNRAIKESIVPATLCPFATYSLKVASW